MAPEEIVDEMMDALDHGTLVLPISERVAGFDLGAGYAFGARLAMRRIERGERPVGRKLGFTNRALWGQLGVNAPFWSCVYDSTVLFANAGAGQVAIDRLAQPRLEPELVVHFASAPAALADAAGLLECIDWIAPAIELVQNHFPDWRFRTPDAIADFGVHGALVVGSPTKIGALEDPLRRLAEFTIVLKRDGESVAVGSGDRVLGSPLRALAHVLAGVEGQAGWEPLQAGDIVTTGTLTGLHVVEPGETWEITTTGIPLEQFRVRID